MDAFDYAAGAGLVLPLRVGRSAPISFRRFETSAAAIKFAVEELTPVMFRGAILETGDDRFGSAQIRMLYDDAAFPLERRG
jgi:hypothetical protein